MQEQGAELHFQWSRCFYIFYKFGQILEMFNLILI
jgi:hypothetical protein